MNLFSHITDDEIRNDVRIRVIPTTSEDSKRPGFVVWYCFLNPHNRRRTVYSFCFNPVVPLGYDATVTLVRMILERYKLSALAGLTRLDPNKCSARNLRSEIFHSYNLMRRSRNGIANLNDKMTKTYTCEDRKKSYYVDPKIYLRKADDSGATSFISGRSFSGKSYYVATQLNHLVNLKRGGSDPHTSGRPMYDKILIMTSSPNCEPFKDLDPSLNITIIPFYASKIVGILKLINDSTLNLCPMLLIIDDCFDQMLGNSYKKLTLTMRNSNISTSTLSQAIKHARPDSRSSFHKMIITKFKTLEWQYLIESAIKDDVEEILGHTGTSKKLAEEFTRFVGNDIVLYNIKRDTVNLIHREYEIA